MGEAIANNDRVSLSWREAREERINYEFERRKREINEERERQAARVAEEKQRVATNNLEAWVGVIDQRIEQHFLSGQLGVGGAREEEDDELIPAANELGQAGVPVFMFQEGNAALAKLGRLDEAREAAARLTSWRRTGCRQCIH